MSTEDNAAQKVAQAAEIIQQWVAQRPAMTLLRMREAVDVCQEKLVLELLTQVFDEKAQHFKGTGDTQSLVYWHGLAVGCGQLAAKCAA